MESLELTEERKHALITGITGACVHAEHALERKSVSRKHGQEWARHLRSLAEIAAHLGDQEGAKDCELAAQQMETSENLYD